MKRKLVYLPKPSQWKGLGYEELMYRRALVSTKLEINNYKIATEVNNLRNGMPAFAGTALKSCFKSLAYLDYIVFAVKAIRRIREMFKKD